MNARQLAILHLSEQEPDTIWVCDLSLGKSLVLAPAEEPRRQSLGEARGYSKKEAKNG
jgi:hypothetical protein